MCVRRKERERGRLGEIERDAEGQVSLNRECRARYRQAFFLLLASLNNPRGDIPGVNNRAKKQRSPPSGRR